MSKGAWSRSATGGTGEGVRSQPWAQLSPPPPSLSCQCPAISPPSPLTFHAGSSWVHPFQGPACNPSRERMKAARTVQCLRTRVSLGHPYQGLGMWEYKYSSSQFLIETTLGIIHGSPEPSVELSQSSPRGTQFGYDTLCQAFFGSGPTSLTVLSRIVY